MSDQSLVSEAAKVINASVVKQARDGKVEIEADEGIEFERRIARALLKAGYLVAPEATA